VPDGFYAHGNATLEWATFALVLLLVLTVGAMLIARFAGGRGRRHSGPTTTQHGGPPDPLDVLRMRFANGQISRDEFLQATSDLTAVPQPPG
jgi:uncharacterized membrane protein